MTLSTAVNRAASGSPGFARPGTAQQGGLAELIDPATLFAGGAMGAWYDMTDLTKLFQDTAGTVPVTDVGQPVARINAKAGTWVPFQQATAGLQPVVTKDAANVHRVYFDAVDDVMNTSASVAMSQTDEVTIVAAVKIRSSTRYPTFLGSGGSTSSGSFSLARGIVTDQNFSAVNRGSVAPTTYPTSAIGGYPGAQTLVVSTRAKISTDYSEIFVNGVSKGLGTGDMGTGGYLTRAATMGKGFGTGLDTDYYHLLVINRLLTADEHTKLIDTFKASMGI